MLVGSLDDAEDLMGDIRIKDIAKNLPRAARAIEFESSRGGGNKLVKKTKEHLEAERKVRGKDGDALQMTERELTKQRRRYRARRIMQEVQKVKNKQAACHTLYCEKGGGKQMTGKNGRRSWKDTRGTSIRMRR